MNTDKDTGRDSVEWAPASPEELAEAVQSAPRVLAVGGRVVDPHHHPVRHLTCARRPLVASHVCDDHRAAVADAQLDSGDEATE